jgi:hypothetical protein
MNRRILLAAALGVFSCLATVQAGSVAQFNRGAVAGGGAGLPARVLHFSQSQSVGEIYLLDESFVVPEVSREFHPGYVFVETQYLGPARGDVAIPAGKCVILHLGGRGVTRQQCLEVLDSLGPNDVRDLDFLAPIQPDDSFLPHVVGLTGLTHFCPVTARFTSEGWSTLARLPRLEHICTPHGLTDAEMAEIARLPALREMEIVGDRLTDAGLASLAKVARLDVLHLEGTSMLTDEGLRTLAGSTTLRHLRLSGPFTDAGMAYLAAMPSLKVLWLEAPKVTEEGLRLLSESKTLERLCVPWIDAVTDRGVEYLKAMPRLKALGIGNARGSDAGVMRLASLTNLEVLALKGGPSLTDSGLQYLPALPKLRALQIYNSGITERGLACLYPIKTLDSIEIQSTAPISPRAIARLRAELPQVQTLDISQPEPAGRPISPWPLARR